MKSNSFNKESCLRKIEEPKIKISSYYYITAIYSHSLIKGEEAAENIKISVFFKIKISPLFLFHRIQEVKLNNIPTEFNITHSPSKYECRDTSNAWIRNNIYDSAREEFRLILRNNMSFS